MSARLPVVWFVARWVGLLFNLRGLIALPRIFPYLRDWRRFRRDARMTAPLADSYPCLADATGVTPFDAHYFYQSAWLARRLASARPAGHVDIGSDVIAIGAISAFVNVTFIDYRPLQVAVAGLQPQAGDILKLPLPTNSVMSLSCLHVIEHIGLGRYGDPINPAGHTEAAAELQRVLARGGSLFLSTPVGRERVCFNAHRVFDPSSIVGLFPSLQLREFAYVDDSGAFREGADLRDAAKCDYGCGMFHFVKPDGDKQ